MPLALACALALTCGTSPRYPCRGSACASGTYAPLRVGVSLDATFDDPILLTFAAARPRTTYLPDEGYTLTRDAEGVVSLVTDSMGDLGVAFREDARVWVRDTDYVSRPRIEHTTSDSAVWSFGLDTTLAVEVRFVVATSRVAALDVWIRNDGTGDRVITVLPWTRKCRSPYLMTAGRPGGVAARNRVEVESLLRTVGQGTYLDNLQVGLQLDGEDVPWSGAASCGANAAEDVTNWALSVDPVRPTETAALLGLRRDVRVPGGRSERVRIRRGAVSLTAADTLSTELDRAASYDLDALITEGHERLARMPTMNGLDRDAQFVFRSSFVLLDQLMMPAEGNAHHDYYLFSREPTWWFARLGQHLHESWSMILMSRFHPEDAIASQRIFIDRIEPDGYLPYNIGPVVEQTQGHTASPPLLAWVSWEIFRNANDATFLRDAYDAAVRVHRFWVDQRDADHDGLVEWGGFPISESVRDLENVIWNNVTSPDRVESLDANVWLVVEERTLGAMAERLGRASDAAMWREASAARARLVNATMWDEATGFYYHVSRERNEFTVNTPNDLRRMEIAGFLPLWANIVPADRRARLLAHLRDPQTFWRTFGVAGLAATDGFYSAEASHCCRWNGPVWVPWQWLIMRGLIELGERDLARDLVQRTYAAVAAQLRAVHQFREIYNPDDAAVSNRSMPNYVWSSMIALMMIESSQ